MTPTDQHKSIIIKSAMGTGKTTLVLDLLKSHKYKSVLYVSSWITFTHFICNKLNTELNKYEYKFIKYNEPQDENKHGFNSFDNPYLVC
jgi:guanylate kinase